MKSSEGFPPPQTEVEKAEQEIASNKRRRFCPKAKKDWNHLLQV